MHLLSARRWPSIVRSLTGLWLVFFLSVGPTLAAATLTVDDDGPADYSSITAALAAATASDTIQVAAGTYDESRETFPLALKDGVAIIGAGRDVTTILTPEDTIAFSNDGTPLGATTALEGFTITQEAGVDWPLMEFLLGDAVMTPRIEGNRFLGNDDESDAGIGVIADGGGGTFDGVVTDNEFTNLGAAEVVGPVSLQLVEGPFGGGGGVILARFGEPIVEAALRSSEPKTAIAPPPDEDRITPTISANTFEGNGFGIATIGSSYYDCSCEPSGVLAPVIDGNTFTQNGIDNLMTYGGFGFREYSPTVSNNTSDEAFLHIGSLPYFYGAGPGLSTSAKSAKKGITLDTFRGLKSKIAEGRIGEQDRPRISREKRAIRPSGVAPEPPEVLYDVTVSGNTITNPVFAGALFYQYMYAVNGITVNAEFSDNTITSPQEALGGIIFGTFLEETTSQLPGTLLFENNAVDGTADALVIQLGSEIADPPTSTAVKVTDAAANDIQIVRNRLENGVVGLTFGSDGYSTSTPLVSCNVIVDNADAGVVIEDGTDPVPDFGGGAATSPGLNSIHDNGTNMVNEDTNQVKAENNYWGSASSATIDASIEGDVDFTPFLIAEPVGCNIIAPTGADLELEKTVTSSGPYVVGSNITYQLTVTNNGPDAATNVEITDPIPTGTDFVSASAGCSANATTITCTAAGLADGASQSFNITLVATDEGVVVNSASADSDEDDPVTANSSDSAPAVVVGAAQFDAIPTASEWGLLLMGVMLAFVGLWFTRRT